MELPVKLQIRVNSREGLEDDSVITVSSTKLEFNRDKEFTFDHIFPSGCSQEEVFKKSALPLLEQLVEGQNVTIMAYGPTGSGKSYTLGTHGLQMRKEQHGLLPRILDWIFDWVDSETENETPAVKVSFLEIYKEELFDLLQSGLTKVEIKNSDKENVIIENINEVVVTSRNEAVSLVHQANVKRQVKKTTANDTSSRSHAIITISLKFLMNGIYRRSQVRIVDLAGSEAVAKDGVSGEIKNEGISINKGLLALGKVITALNSKTATHIPYRESILTRALKDSLSGNSVTVLICCIKPNAQSIAATSNTLQFAAKARALKTKVIYSNFKTPRPMRTPLASIKSNVVTPGGSCFAVPSVKFNMQKTFDDLEESILVSGCHGAVYRRMEPQSLEDRLHDTAMKKIDAFLEEFRERMSQSLLSHNMDASARFSHPTTLKQGESSRLTMAQPKCQISHVFSETLNASVVDNRRRSARLALKKISNNTVRGDDSNYEDAERTIGGSRKAPALPLPTPEGSHPQQLAHYRSQVLAYVNAASVYQLQKLATVGAKAAQGIVNYRTVSGRYQDLDALQNVPGMRKNFYSNFLKVNISELLKGVS